MYTIKHAAALTGIPADTLRMWERRYRVVTPIRTQGGYRLYDDAAIARLTAMHALVAAGWLSAGTGCLSPMYSADPARRAQELIYTSEDLRAFLDEWERIWFLDQPSHMTPLRTHGGII